MLIYVQSILRKEALRQFVHGHFLLHCLWTQNHRTVEFRRTSWGHLVWLPLLDVCQLSRTMSRHISNGGESADSLGKTVAVFNHPFFDIQTNPLWYNLVPCLFYCSFKYLNKIFWKRKKGRKIPQNFWSGSFQTNIKYLFFIVDQHINSSAFFTSNVKFSLSDYLLKYVTLSIVELENLRMNLYFRFKWHEKYWISSTLPAQFPDPLWDTQVSVCP